jgi:methylated-DNA-[protein]-cysteine S-methyltransferase
MHIGVEYTIFKTKWGYFGLAGAESGIFRTHLPAHAQDSVKIALLAGLSRPRQNMNYFTAVQDKITAYFDGSYVDFSRDIPLLLDGMSFFARGVLTACMDITYGQTMSYGQLARRAGRANAARAVGAVMAANPLPLLIPCHRVLRSDGQIGGFSAGEGVELKKKLLGHEKCCLAQLIAAGSRVL